MTPSQLNIYVEEYRNKKDIERKDSVYQAYLISRWVWAKKIDIEKILDIRKEKKIMTDEQMLERVKMLNAVFGGEEITSVD